MNGASFVCRCRPENRSTNVWNNEQLRLRAKQLLDNWEGPLYVEMNRTEAGDFPPPAKRQLVTKGTLRFSLHVTRTLTKNGTDYQSINQFICRETEYV